MKYIFISLLAILFLITTSCKKDEQAIFSSVPVNGIWASTYSSRGAKAEVEPNMFRIQFKDNDTFSCLYVSSGKSIPLTGKYRFINNDTLKIELPNQKVYPNALIWKSVSYVTYNITDASGKNHDKQNLEFVDHNGDLRKYTQINE